MLKFNELINSTQPVLVDFTAEWCGPCKQMSPIVKEVASKISEKAKIIKVDIDKNPVAAKLYKVDAVPTFLLFKNGEIKWRQTGMATSEQLMNILIKFI